MSDDFLIIKNVRVSFPHLWEFPSFADGPGKAGCVVLFDAGHADVAEVRAAIAATQARSKFANIRLPSSKICLTEIGESGRPEYGDNLSMTANAAKDKLPVVMSADGRSRVTSAAKCLIYAGCFVNVKVRFWAQDSTQWGKRINCELIAIQFAGDGEPLSASYISEADAMAGFGEAEFADAADGFEL